MPKEKKKGTFLKAGIISFIGLATIANVAKNFLFGNPPNKLRKTLFYTSLGALLVYNSCGDEIGKNLSKAYNKIDDIYNNSLREENKFLEEQIEQKEEMFSELQDSINLYKNNLEKNMFESDSKINKLENNISVLYNSIDSLIEKPKSSENKIEEKLIIKKYVHKQNKIDTLKQHDEWIYWHIVENGENIYDISEEFLGTKYYYDEILKTNSLYQSFELKKGFPIVIPDKNGLCSENLIFAEYPKYISTMKKGQTLEEFVNNLDAKVTLRSVYDYNSFLGNEIPFEGFSDVDEAIVYIPVK